MVSFNIIIFAFFYIFSILDDVSDPEVFEYNHNTYNGLELNNSSNCDRYNNYEANTQSNVMYNKSDGTKKIKTIIITFEFLSDLQLIN